MGHILDTGNRFFRAIKVEISTAVDLFKSSSERIHELAIIRRYERSEI